MNWGASFSFGLLLLTLVFFKSTSAVPKYCVPSKFLSSSVDHQILYNKAILSPSNTETVRWGSGSNVESSHFQLILPEGFTLTTIITVKSGFSHGIGLHLYLVDPQTAELTSVGSCTSSGLKGGNFTFFIPSSGTYRVQISALKRGEEGKYKIEIVPGCSLTSILKVPAPEIDTYANVFSLSLNATNLPLYVFALSGNLSVLTDEPAPQSLALDISVASDLRAVNLYCLALVPSPFPGYSLSLRLYFESTTLTSVSLPSLAMAEGINIWDSPNLANLFLPSLKRTGYFNGVTVRNSFKGALNLPSLEYGNFELSSSNLMALCLPKLTIVANFWIINATYLKEILLPNLFGPEDHIFHGNSMEISNNLALTKFSAPQVVEVPQLIIYNNPRLTIYMPKLKSIHPSAYSFRRSLDAQMIQNKNEENNSVSRRGGTYYLHSLISNLAQTTLSLNKLVAVADGNLEISSNPNMKSVSLKNLKFGAENFFYDGSRSLLSIKGNPSLTTLTLTHLDPNQDLSVLACENSKYLKVYTGTLIATSYPEKYQICVAPKGNCECDSLPPV